MFRFLLKRSVFGEYTDIRYGRLKGQRRTLIAQRLDDIRDGARVA